MAFEMQRRIDELYGPLGRETLKKAVNVTKDGGSKVNETLARNTGIPPYYFSRGPNGVFLMGEPENENYVLVGLGNNVYRLPDFFKGGELGVYGETKYGRVIGIKPKFIEGPYNREKLEECDEAIYAAKLLRMKTKRGTRERNFLNDYIRVAKEERRLMKNPKRTTRYVLTHESTHRALADIKVADKLTRNENEGITENVTQHAIGYSLLGPAAPYTWLRDNARKLYGGIKGIYKTIRNKADVPRHATALA